MKRIDADVNSILSLDDKRQLLREIGQEELLDIFKKNYTPKYTPTPIKKAPLDQQISFSVSAEEKKILSEELFQIRKVGPGISISAYVRNQVVSDIDLKEWADIAYQELKKLNSLDYDKDNITKKKRRIMLEMENTDDNEDLMILNKEFNKLNDRLEYLKKTSFRRKYRLSGRVTFSEAQTIRWRAARLNLSIADYLRYLMFDYKPGGEPDLNLSLEDRKRFYISILDVYKNGWNEPEKKEECQNCIRYLDEIKKLKEQINRYKIYIDKEGIEDV